MHEPDPPQMPTPDEHRLEAELRVCDPNTTDTSMTMDPARLKRMQDELAQGFELIKKYRLAATFFGSSRAGSEDQMYQDATVLAGKLSKSGFAVITGGAGGIMEAANKGAYDAGGQSVGLNIALSAEQRTNAYLTEHKTFNYFFTRKVMLSFAAEVYVFFPGGFGTLNEFFEIVTLIQTNKIKRVPVILYGSAYWAPLLALLKEHVYGTYHGVDKADLDIYRVVNGVEEAYERILKSVKC